MIATLRALSLFALVAAGLGLLAWTIAWWRQPLFRLRRALRRILGARPAAEALSPGQGRAAGLAAEGLAVLWDTGDRGLVYRFDEIEGAELIVDGEIAARVRRGEAGKALERLHGKPSRVALRLIFTDPRWPEFELELQGAAGGWALSRSSPADEQDPVRQGRRWLAHIDAILKRRPRPRPAEPVPAPVAPMVAPSDESRDEDG